MSLAQVGGATFNLAQYDDNFSIWLDVLTKFEFPTRSIPSLGVLPGGRRR